MLLAPSTLAASISSVGSAWSRYCRMKNTPKALTSVGRMTACNWSVHSSLATIMYSGTTLSCGGTIIVPMTRSSSRFLNRNRSLAKANPASVEKTTVPTEIVPATITVLNRASPMLASVQAIWRFLNRLLPNQKGGGVWASRVLFREAAIAVHTSGNSEPIVKTVSTA
jgi:hypothetical protein